MIDLHTMDNHGSSHYTALASRKNLTSSPLLASRQLLFFFKCIFLCMFLTFSGPDALLFADEREKKISRTTLLHVINTLRIENELFGLEEEPILKKTAQQYAEYMVEKNHFSHVDPQGRKGVDRVREAGGTWVNIGEIIGIGPDEDSILTAWMMSTSHRNMILKRRWTYVGVGSAKRGDEVLSVVLFAETKCLRARIEKDGEALVIETNDWYEGSGFENYEAGSEEFRYFIEMRGKRNLQAVRKEDSPQFLFLEGTVIAGTTLLRFGITFSQNPWEGKIYHHITYSELVY